MIKNLKEDKKAKTKSYFLNNQYVIFNKNLLDFMIDYFKREKKDLRICLHKNIDAKHHDMIILQQKKNFYKPHKHKRKGETYHIINGKMCCVMFNNYGKIKSICLLKRNEIFRTPLNVYHTMLPVSEFVIYHESKLGPLLKKNDSVFPKWINKFNNKNEVIEFKKLIFKSLRKNST